MTIKKILQLPPLKRIHIVEQILASLNVPDPKIERAWAIESDRRLAAYKKGLIKAIPLEVVKKRLSK